MDTQELADIKRKAKARLDEGWDWAADAIMQLIADRQPTLVPEKRYQVLYDRVWELAEGWHNYDKDSDHYHRFGPNNEGNVVDCNEECGCRFDHADSIECTEECCSGWCTWCQEIWQGILW
jgi:hypothetical protein